MVQTELLQQCRACCDESHSKSNNNYNDDCGIIFTVSNHLTVESSHVSDFVQPAVIVTHVLHSCTVCCVVLKLE